MEKLTESIYAEASNIGIKALPLSVTVMGRQKSVTVAGVLLNPTILSKRQFFFVVFINKIM